jgi:hypothetical protein
VTIDLCEANTPVQKGTWSTSWHGYKINTRGSVTPKGRTAGVRTPTGRDGRAFVTTAHAAYQLGWKVYLVSVPSCSSASGFHATAVFG